MTDESIPSGALKVAEECKRLAQDVRYAITKQCMYPSAKNVHCCDTLDRELSLAIDRLAVLASPSPATGALMSEERIAELNRAAQDQSIRGIAPSLHLARAVEAEVRAALSSAKREAEPLTQDQVSALLLELNSPCVTSDSPSAMFLIIVRAIEAAHGITAASQVEPEDKPHD